MESSPPCGRRKRPPATIDQYLAAGLVDEVELHVAPIVLGGGARLFEGVGPNLKLELLRTIEAPGVSHLKYRIADGGKARG